MKQLLVMLVNLFFVQQLLIGQSKEFYQRAVTCLKTIEKLYQVNDGTYLFRETYPFDIQHQASYLGTESSFSNNTYSYLWPFSGSLSAYVAMYEFDKKEQTLAHINDVVWTGLSQYEDLRTPIGYASYVKEAPTSDRFYDDNIWLGIDFADLYLLT